MELGLSAEVAIGGFLGMLVPPIDFEMYANLERMAARTSMFSDDFYGVVFATFREDFTAFADLLGLGLSESDVALVADMLDWYVEYMSIPVSPHHFDTYMELYHAFAISVEGDPVDMGDGVTRIDYTYTLEDLMQLLRDMLNHFEQDEVMRAHIDMQATNPAMAALDEEFDDVFGTTMEALWDALDDADAQIAEAGLVVVITESNFIANGRMQAIQVSAVVTSEDETGTLLAIFDFGDAVYDTWTLDVYIAEEGEEMEAIFRAEWAFEALDGTYVNTITLQPLIIDATTYTLSATWDSETGAFTLRYASDWDTFTLSGTFTVEGSVYTIVFDAFDVPFVGEVSLWIERDANAPIPDVDFVSMANWDETVVARFMDLMDNLGGLMEMAAMF